MTTRFEEGYSLVSAILPKDGASEVIQKTIPESVETAINISARGSITKDKWYQTLLPSISPEQVVLEVLVPETQANTLMDNLTIAGSLNLSGNGAIYKVDCEKVLFTKPTSDITIPALGANGNEFNYKEDLLGIYCIVQKEKADQIAKAAMREGAPGPTVVFGQGRGIRERMGVLRIAISPEKELIRVVVDNYDAEPVFEAMVKEGKLDTPGMGFIYSMPVQKGLINVASVYGSRSQLATNHQMIKAIDDLRGGTDWRAKAAVGGDAKDSERKYLSDLTRLSCVTERGKGDSLIDAAMTSGAPGASVTYGNKVGGEGEIGSTGIKVSREMEIIEMTVAHKMVNEIVDAMNDAAKNDEIEIVYFYTQPVPKALTYLG